MSRSEELFGLVERFNASHNGWAGDQSNDNPPPIGYWRACQEMVDGFQEGDLPGNCRVLAVRVFEFAKQVVVFDSTDEVWPKEEFWASREALERAFQDLGSPAEKYYVEPMQVLRDQQVPDQQIAQIWGLTNPDGSGKAWLVEKELKHPGSVITPDWVHPEQKQIDAEAERVRGEYRQMAATAENLELVKVEEEEKKCPETPRELFDQGMSAHMAQAAAMLKMPESEVQTLFEGFRQADAMSSESVKLESLEHLINGPPLPLSDEDVAKEPGGFDDWSYDALKQHARELDVEFRGNPKRTDLIDWILAAEAKVPQEVESE